MSHTPASRTTKSPSTFAVVFPWLAIALLILMIFSSVGMLIARQEAIASGVRYMSSAIERSLAQANLEGVDPLVSVGVRDCVTKRRNQGLSVEGSGFFAFDELETLGAQAYRACYIEQLESARLLSNPVALGQALETVGRQ